MSECLGFEGGTSGNMKSVGNIVVIHLGTKARLASRSKVADTFTVNHVK